MDLVANPIAVVVANVYFKGMDNANTKTGETKADGNVEYRWLSSGEKQRENEDGTWTTVGYWSSDVGMES